MTSETKAVAINEQPVNILAEKFIGSLGTTVGGFCPQCSRGKVYIEKEKTGGTVERTFLGCTCFPLCRYFQWIH